MSVGKTKRYKVLEMFNYTCAYCGRRVPDVVLEVDHIHPVSKGGTDDLSNLVAACFDCNRGKSAREPGSVPTEVAERLAVAKERLAQLNAMRRCESRINAEIDRMADEAEAFWWDMYGQPPDTRFVPEARRSLRKFVVALGVENVKDMMAIASGKTYGDGTDMKQYKYLAKCCWNQIRDIEARNA